MNHIGILLTFFTAAMVFGSVSANAANPIYRPGDVMTMKSQKGKPVQEGGNATLICKDKTLVLTVDFIDSDIGNSAVKHNEKTWTTGDVCEFFFQPAGRKDYYEFHVTPNNITLQLHIPSVEQLRVLPFESKIFESNFKYNAKIEKGHWTVRMEIPLSVLGDNAKFNGSLFAVCRYNYNKKWEEPELSSSTPLPDGFHCPTLWHKIVE